MTNPMKTPKSKGRSLAKKPRISRRLVGQLLADLSKHLDETAWVAEALAKAAKPNSDTLMGAYPMLKVLELAFRAHEHDVRQARDFARIIAEKVPA
jgi:hypothetical protein